MMESIGPKLRQARLRSGLTLEEVSNSTRIPVRILLAIEEDDQAQVGSRFFYNSFARQFAAHLKLDESEINAGIDAALADLPKPLVPGEAGTPMPPGLAPLRPRRTKKSRWLLSVGSLAGMLLACSGVYSFWQSSRYDLPDSLANLLGSSGEKVAAAGATASTAKPASPPLTEQRAASARTQSAQSGFRLEVSAVEKTWLSVSADGKEIYSGILQTAESKELEGQRTARVRAGNAGGIQVVFNGKTIGPLGPKGQVRTAVFTRDRYTILEPAATSFALSHLILIHR